MMNYEPTTPADKAVEDRMAPALSRVLRPILFAMEEQDMQVQAENSRVLDIVARAAWREFRAQFAKQNASKP